MNEKATFVLSHNKARQRAVECIKTAPQGWVVEVHAPQRSLTLNSKFHAICNDFSKSGIEWAGKPRVLVEWKVLLVSGHGVATGQEAEVVTGLEGELVNLRESTAQMSGRRCASLIEYAHAFGADLGVRFQAPFFVDGVWE